MIVVDARGRAARRLAPAPPRAPTTRSRPEIAAALRGALVQEQRGSPTRSAQDILATAVPVLRGGRPPAPCGSRRASPAVHRAVRRTIGSGSRLIGALVLALGLVAGALIAAPGRAADPRASTRGRARVAGGDLDARARSRARPSSARSRARSTT